ncbi:hypothetical protein CRE_05049 [Caenorhabditis remanei]|uniref:Nose resistant-to-fluoxetine protein N-terminal domain-containing protein n=1 Tax=Caenorhabditis remanei TaxID=31234 RepID=E3MZ83_CAERE|nr:hypothetical protein CRE_05049 [Caenorhabditis remanei]
MIILTFSFFLFLFTLVAGQSWKEVFLTSKVTGVSAQCANDTETWLNSLKLVAEVSNNCLTGRKNCTKEEEKIIEGNLYAVEQYDAWGKFPASGIFQVPLLWDGSYQECERISGEIYETNYCYMILFPGKNATCQMSDGEPTSTAIRGAVCMPYSCSQEDLPAVYNQISNQPFTACGAFCSKYPVKKTPAFWGFTSFMAVMVAIVVVTTLADYLKDTLKKEDEVRKDGKLLQMAMTFSMWTNAGLLLSVKEQKPGFIKCLDCIRFLSILWVITGHTFSYLMTPDQVLSVLPFTGRFWNHLVLSAFFSVDTFFLLSGIVVAYLFFKTRPKLSQIKSPVTWILFYVHRYLRLTPPLMVFIGFLVVYGYYIQGPGVASQMNQLNPQADVCAQYWWQNMLYINNLYPNANQCYGITWYLGVDTQLYLAAPIFLIGLYFSFAVGTALLVAAIVGSIIAVYILFGTYDLPADFFGNGDSTYFYDIIYDKPWIRGTPYFIGIFVGYFLAIYGKRKIRLNWALSVTGWLIAFGIAMMCIFSSYDYDRGILWSIFIRASYYNFSRIGWAIAVSWVIVANHMGWGGRALNYFYPYFIFRFQDRLIISCHFLLGSHWEDCHTVRTLSIMLFYIFTSASEASVFIFTQFMYYSVPTALLTYMFAFFWSCFFEIPFLKLEKILIEAIIGVGGRRAGDAGIDNLKIPKAKEGELWDADVEEVSEKPLSTNLEEQNRKTLRV